MRRAWLVGWLVIALAGVAFAEGREPRGKFIAADGTVTLERPGQSGPIYADVGYELFEGDVVTTGEDGRAKLWLAGQLAVSLGASTRVEVGGGIHNLRDRFRVSYLELQHGVLRVLVKKRENYSHTTSVETPGATVVGHNGYFLVEHFPADNCTQALNLAGDLQMRGPENRTNVPVVVPQGKIAAAQGLGTIGTPYPPPEAVQQQMLLATEIGNDYIWRQRPGSADYLIETTWDTAGEGAAPTIQGLAEALEGEAGADFDTFGNSSLREQLREEDFPKPSQDRATVLIRLLFPEGKKK